MANRITGTTDTTGAISVRPKTEKSLLIVCEPTGSTTTAVPEQIYTISGTSDAEAKFGETAGKLVKILINNGVDNIKCIAVGKYGAEVEGAKYENIADAYEGAMTASLGEPSIKCVILDTTSPTVINALKTHLDFADGEDIFRYGIIGSVSADVDAAGEEAVKINHKRIFMPFPYLVDNSNVKLDGIYAAAGLAALIMTETSDPALPMNGVEFVGFGGTSMHLLKAHKTTLEQKGVTAIVGDSTPAVWRLVTTRTKDANNYPDIVWHEGTTLFIADDVLSTVIDTLKATYKRTKNVSRILDAIKTTVIGILEIKEALEIIENFDKTTVTVIQDPEDIYGALVDYEINVVTPLYTVTINQHLKL